MENDRMGTNLNSGDGVPVPEIPGPRCNLINGRIYERYITQVRKIEFKR